MMDVSPELNRGLSAYATRAEDTVEACFRRESVKRLKILRYDSDDLDDLFTGLGFEDLHE